MAGYLLIAAFVVMLCVLGTLVAGLYTMSRGGDFNQKHSNRLMQIRVYLQGLALALLALAYFASY